MRRVGASTGSAARIQELVVVKADAQSEIWDYWVTIKERAPLCKTSPEALTRRNTLRIPAALNFYRGFNVKSARREDSRTHAFL